MTSASGKPKAVIYARVSTRKQEEAGTIETQIDFITHDPVMGVKFDLLPRETWYLDTAQSGSKKPLWGRREGKRLFEDVKANDCPFDVILCYKFNRLGRKMIDSEQAINELLAAGVVIYDVKNQMTLDNSSAAGILIRQMMGIMAEFEATNDAEAMRDGQERLAREGKLMPTYVRLGYDWANTDEYGKKAKGAKMVIIPKEAELVRLIFDLYERTPQSRLCKWLNVEGYRLPCKSAVLRKKYMRTERMFYQNDINRIVSCSLYTGLVEWGKTTKIQGRSPTPYSHHIPDLQIISFEQFNRVQRIRELRRVVPSKSAGSPYIYSGLVRCPRCGGRTVGKRQWHPNYDYRETRRYECAAYNKMGKAACRGSSAYEQTITKAAIPFIADLLENKMGLRYYVEEEARNMVMDSQESRIQRLQGQIAAAQAQLKRVQEITIQGLMTTEEAKPFIYDARETIERNTAQLAGLEESASIRQELTEAIARVCSDITGTLERLEPLALQAVIRQIFKSFSINKRGHGRTQEAWVETYEFTNGLKDLLASFTLNTDAPAFEIV